jgi:hypothetical protein
VNDLHTEGQWWILSLPALAFAALVVAALTDCG